MTRQNNIDFEAIFASAPAASLVLTPELVIAAASDRYLELVKHTRKDLVGHTLPESFPDGLAGPYALQDLHASLERVLACRETERMPVRRGGSDHGHYTRATNSPLRDRDGSILYLIHSLDDVTDIVDVRQEPDKGGDLVRLRQEFDQFAYAASHDLQEPLRMVTSYVQLLARRYKGRLDQDADEFIDFALDGARRMHDMIADLLRFSRLGTQARPFAPVSMDAVLDQALDKLQRQIEITGATVARTPLPVVMADEAQMVMVFQHLIDNALKFRGDAPPNIRIGHESGNGFHLFHVQDNGIGIDQQQAERVFVIFQRLHHRGSYPGTGMGLTLCKKIVERHHGRIWVEPAPDHGTRFCFTIAGTEGNEHEQDAEKGG